MECVAGGNQCLYLNQLINYLLMKKSNKILLGGFLTLVLVLVSVYMTLSARYKAGHYTSYNGNMDEEAIRTQEFANTRHIDVRYFKNVSVRVGDRMKVEQFGYDAEDIILTQKGGTVQLSLKDSTSNDNMYGYMVVYVPENSLVSAHKATLRIEGNQGKKINALHIVANGSHVAFQQPKNMLQIDSLNVEATNNATIELQNAQIDKLAVQLNGSELHDQQAVINQLKLNADSVSRINLQAKHFINYTTKTAAHE